MGQLNISLDDVLLEHVDRLASAQGQTRPEFLRTLVRAAIAADGEGRPLFSAPESPADLSQLGLVAQKIGQLSIDLDQVLRDQDRRAARIENQHSANEKSIRLAQIRLAAKLRERMDSAYGPFQRLVEDMQAGVDARLEALHAAVENTNDLEKFKVQLSKYNRRLIRARPLLAITIGRDSVWTPADLFIVGLPCLLLSIIFLIGVGRALPVDVVANPLSIAMNAGLDHLQCQQKQADLAQPEPDKHSRPRRHQR